MAEGEDVYLSIIQGKGDDTYLTVGDAAGEVQQQHAEEYQEKEEEEEEEETCLKEALCCVVLCCVVEREAHLVVALAPLCCASHVELFVVGAQVCFC